MSDPVLDYEPGALRVLQSKDEIRAFYDKIAGVYDLLAEFSEQPLRDAGLKLLAAKTGETVLETGCGTGHCLVELTRGIGEQGKVVGVDISENMLAEARKLSPQNMELHQCDAAKLAFADATFDGIFTSFTLELFDTPELPGVLAEWRRVLKPGGRLVVVAISKEEPQNFLVKAFEWTHRHFPNLMDCRPIHVRRALEAAGFVIGDATVQSMWVPVEVVLGVTP